MNEQEPRYKAETRAPGVNVVVDTRTGWLLTAADAGPPLTFNDWQDADKRAKQMNSRAQQ